MISICLASFNGESYIKEQLDSILPQIGRDDEIVISDDNSSDNTQSIIRSYNDSRIRLFLNSKNNKGYSKNFENAVRNARGDYIFLSDQDDVWHKEKIKITMEKLRYVNFVASNAEFVSENLVSLGIDYFTLRGGKKGFFNNLIKLRFLGACIAFKRDILTKALPFPEKVKLCPHDLWITLISEFYFRTETIDIPLIKYRRHSNNVSEGGINSSFSAIKKIQFRLYSLFLVLSRMFNK